MRLTLFKIPQHRVFHHIPIYYDEAQEKREERAQNAREELGLPTEDEKAARVGSKIKGGMRRRHQDFFEQSYAEKKKSTLRLVLIIVGLSLIAYYLMGEYRDVLFEMFF